MPTPKLRIETVTSPPITTPDAQISVRSQVVQIPFPSVNGGFIWNRPVAVVVRPLNGDEKVIPILDVTRIAVFSLAGICLTAFFAFMFLRRKTFNS